MFARYAPIQSYYAISHSAIDSSSSSVSSTSHPSSGISLQLQRRDCTPALHSTRYRSQGGATLLRVLPPRFCTYYSRCIALSSHPADQSHLNKLHKELRSLLPCRNYFVLYITFLACKEASFKPPLPLRTHIPFESPHISHIVPLKASFHNRLFIPNFS